MATILKEPVNASSAAKASRWLDWVTRAEKIVRKIASGVFIGNILPSPLDTGLIG
jgi:hypothetical protein